MKNLENPCGQCKHCQLAVDFTDVKVQQRSAKCHAPQNQEMRKVVNAYTGEVTMELFWMREHCSSHREDGFFDRMQFNTCGRKGIWFKPKEGE